MAVQSDSAWRRAQRSCLCPKEAATRWMAAPLALLYRPGAPCDERDSPCWLAEARHAVIHDVAIIRGSRRGEAVGAPKTPTVWWLLWTSS
jgi:hypothetical protein